MKKKINLADYGKVVSIPRKKLHDPAMAAMLKSSLNAGLEYRQKMERDAGLRPYIEFLRNRNYMQTAPK